MSLVEEWAMLCSNSHISSYMHQNQAHNSSMEKSDRGEKDMKILINRKTLENSMIAQGT